MADTDLILVSRIEEFLPEDIYWDDVLLTVSDIKDMLNNNLIKEIDEPFPDIPTYERLKSKKYNKEWHVGRIKYFINHPEKITPISLDNDCSGGFISGYPIILDGHHRLIASILRQDKYIEAYYSGLVTTVDYLTGAVNKIDI